MEKNRQNLNSDELVAYIRKMGFEVTIDTNPSPEKLAQIDRYFKRQKELEVLFKSKTNKLED